MNRPRSAEVRRKFLRGLRVVVVGGVMLLGLVPQVSTQASEAACSLSLNPPSRNGVLVTGSGSGSCGSGLNDLKICVEYTVAALSCGTSTGAGSRSASASSGCIDGPWRTFGRITNLTTGESVEGHSSFASISCPIQGEEGP